MKLKAMITGEVFTALADSLKELYQKQEDGTYILDVDDKDYKAKLSEFRENNRTLIKEREKLNEDLKKFDGVDPEKYAQAQDLLRQMEADEELNLIKDGKLDDVIKRRTETMKSAYDKQLTDMQKRYQALETDFNGTKSQYKQVLLRTEVTEAVGKVGSVRAGALADVLSRANSVWQITPDGKLEAPNKFNAKGESLSLEDWGRSLLEEAPHLFESAQGGGGKGGNKINTTERNGIKTLVNPSAEDYGKNLEAIATGKMGVDIVNH